VLLLVVNVQDKFKVQSSNT